MKVPVCQRRRVTRERTHCEDLRSRWKDSISADFGWRITQGNRKLASIVSVSEPTMRRIAKKDFQYKSYTLKSTTDDLWGCQDKPSCSPRFPFWPPNSPDLNLLDYYVWNIGERDTNISASQCDVIKDRYWGSIRRHGQCYITACVRIENTGRHSS